MLRLYFTKHARDRMVLRGITMAEVKQAIKEGSREPRSDGAVLHYYLSTRIGVIVNWRDMVVITVVNLSESHYKALRERREKERNGESLYGL